MSANTRVRIVLGICILCAVASAWALSTDKSQPINIQADHGDFQGDSKTNNGTGVYTGHVIITQGSLRITADKAILHMLNGEIQTADMTGAPATFQQQPDTGALSHGIADEITYDANKNEVDLMGNAHLQQGERLLAADVIHYNTDTEHVVATGGKTSDGRINIIIPPKQSTSPPAGAERPNQKKHPLPESTPPLQNSNQGGPP